MKRCLAFSLLIAMAALTVWPAPAFASPCGDRYIVQRGDTLYRIARKCGATVAGLAMVNNLSNPNRIYVGQVLVIPAGASPAPGPAQTPRIIAFSVSPATFTPGDRLTLTWQATGERATLCPQTASLDIAGRCVSVPVTGSTTILTDSDAINYTTFQLTVEAGGSMANASVPVRPQCQGDRGWFFGNPPPACPRSPPLRSHAAAQRFERGRMIWVETLGVYYVFLYGDRPTLQPFRQLTDPLALKPNASPDNRIGLAPPPGHSEPVSGFGLLWREEAYGAEGLRAQLGWAVEPEFGFDTQIQCEAALTYSWSCYVQTPERTILNYGYTRLVGMYWTQK